MLKEIIKLLFNLIGWGLLTGVVAFGFCMIMIGMGWI